MNSFGLTFHHLGLAVSKPEKAILFLKAIGYTIGQQVFDDRQNVNLIMCNGNGMPDVEMIFASDTTGPLNAMLAERKEMIYHICYSTPKADQVVTKMKDAGIHVICVSPPTPAILFDNHLVSFYQVAGFGLIEFVEM